MQLFNASPPDSTAIPHCSHLSWPWCLAGCCIEKLNVVLMCSEHVPLPAYPVYGAKEKKGRLGQTDREPLGDLPDHLQGKCLYSGNLRAACFPTLIQPPVKRQADQDGHGVGTLEGKQEREVPKGR